MYKTKNQESVELSLLSEFQEELLRLFPSSSSMEKTRSLCSSSSILLVVEEMVRSRRPGPAEEWRAEPGWRDRPLSCSEIMDMEDWRPGLETNGELSYEVRLPIGPRLGLPIGFNDDSRSGEPMWGKDEPMASSSFFCRCLANSAPKRDGLDASGDPFFEKLALVMPRPLTSR